MIKDSAVFYNLGRSRKNNEDSYLDPKLGRRIFAVADGMGGYGGGEIASRMAIATLQEAFRLNPEVLDSVEQTKELLSSVLTEVNSAVRAKAATSPDLKNMGSTLVVSVDFDDRVLFANIGDSRGYIIRKGKATQCTTDNSLVQFMFENGIITREEMSTHPKRNIITKAIGADATASFDFTLWDKREDDLILLCSDGLTEHIDPSDMRDSIWDGSCEKIVWYLGGLALAGGGSDNITVVLCRIGKDNSND